MINYIIMDKLNINLVIYLLIKLKIKFLLKFFPFFFVDLILYPLTRLQITFFWENKKFIKKVSTERIKSTLLCALGHVIEKSWTKLDQIWITFQHKFSIILLLLILQANCHFLINKILDINFHPLGYPLPTFQANKHLHVTTTTHLSFINLLLIVIGEYKTINV